MSVEHLVVGELVRIVHVFVNEVVDPRVPDDVVAACTASREYHDGS